MPASESFPHYIEFRHVYKTFDHPVLVDSNFHVNPGETVAIIGRSRRRQERHARATSWDSCKPDSGQVIVAHEDVTNFDEAEMRRIRKKVTMVFQSGALFDSLTVGENVLFSLELREDYDSQNKEDVVNGLLQHGGHCSRPRTPIPPICPPATNARWPSRGRWPPSRSAFCTTSRPPWSTRS